MNRSRPTQASIARELGITPAAVTKLKARGMPVTSADAARQWRRENIPPRKRRPDPGPSEGTLLERVRLLSKLGEHAERIGRFDLIDAALRSAMREVPPHLRASVNLTLGLWRRLLGSCTPNQTQCSSPDAPFVFADEQAARAAYSLACGDARSEPSRAASLATPP